MKRAGDPTPNSPAHVLGDRTQYCMVDSVQLSNSIVRLTVLHRGTETMWQTMYTLFHAGIGASWYQVRPQQVTVVEYVRVTS